MEAASTPANHPLLQGPPNLARRNRVNRLLEVVAWISAVLAVAVLGIVVGSIFVKGVGSLNGNFFTQSTVGFGAGGGIANAIVGSGIIVGIATLMAVPVGILVALYTSEFAGPRASGAIRYVLDILNGVPTIITGIFVFGLLVAGHHGSGFAASVGLAIVMLPLVARSAHEVLTLVPSAVKEAGLALGISRWRTVLSVIVPSALGGLLTGALLAVARAAGETAPLLFTSAIFADGVVSTDPSNSLASIPIVIFRYSQSPTPEQHDQAWAAALLLILFVLLLSIVARLFSARARKRLGGGR